MWQLVGGSKCRADITASIPGDLRVIFKVQKEPFFHQATEGLAACLLPSVFQLGIHPEMLSPAMREQVDATNSSFGHDLASHFWHTSLWSISIFS